MSKKKQKFLEKIKPFLPYFVAAIIIIGLVFVGSLDKRNSSNNVSMDTFATNDYDVSVDQMSELYVVADLSDALSLASASQVSSNYVATTSMYESGQTATGKLEKPAITNISSSRGVVEYEVKEGENVDTIASKFGASADQIRWSNGLKTVEVEAGTTLKIPSTPGIVYTVKADDTIDSIVEKYGSNSTELIALNDLEISGLSEGMQIVIKDGSLPEKERPEYVPPAPARRVTTYTYTYLGNTSERQDIQVVGWFYGLGGPYAAGQCTQWAWYKRQDIPSNFGNAGSWAANARANGYPVNNTPAAGAIFQNGGGYYGHVGYVESVNPDGSIVVTEMNYIIPYRVIRSIIPANAVGRFNYIHYR